MSTSTQPFSLDYLAVRNLYDLAPTIAATLSVLEPVRLQRILDLQPHTISATKYLDGHGRRDLRGAIESWTISNELTSEPSDPLPAFQDPHYDCDVEREWQALVEDKGPAPALTLVQNAAQCLLVGQIKA